MQGAPSLKQNNQLVSKESHLETSTIKHYCIILHRCYRGASLRRCQTGSGTLHQIDTQSRKEDGVLGNREHERRDKVLLHLESCRHICSSMMSVQQPSAVILDRSQVEQRYRLAPCRWSLPFCTHHARSLSPPHSNWLHLTLCVCSWLFKQIRVFCGGFTVDGFTKLFYIGL